MTPAHDIILFLLLDLGVEKAERQCEKFKLLMPPAYVADLAQELKPPPVFFLRNRRHKASIAYLRGLGIEQLARGGPEVRDCFELLERPQQRELVEAWAIAGADQPMLSRALETRGWSPAPGTVECYLSHFFDVTRVTRAELRKLTRHLHDARSRAACLPLGQTAIMAASLAMGNPTLRLDLHSVLTQTRNILALRTLEAAAGTARSARAAERYSIALQRVVDTLQKSTDPVEEVSAQLSRLRLHTRETPRTMISDLVGEVGTSLVCEETGPGDLPLDLEE